MEFSCCYSERIYLVVDMEEDNLFLLRPTSRDVLGYKILESSIEKFSSIKPSLIQNSGLFLPQTRENAQIQEFEEKIGINYVEFESNIIRIYKESECPTCGPYVVIGFDNNLAGPYSLDNDFEWNTFPEVSVAHKIIEENLLVGNFSDCVIGKGKHHDYTISNYIRKSEKDHWFFNIALKCEKEPTWNDAFIRLNPDGTYERLEIERDRQPLKGQNENSYFYLIIISVVIIVTIILLVIYLRKDGQGVKCISNKLRDFDIDSSVDMNLKSLSGNWFIIK